MDPDSAETLEQCGRAISRAIREEKRVTVVIGNGCYWLPILPRDQVVQWVALRRSIEECDPTSPLLDAENLKDAWFNPARRAELLAEHAAAVAAQEATIRGDDLEVDRLVWSHNEGWRCIAYDPHSPGKYGVYISLYYLTIEQQLVDTIVSTNYDSILASVFRDLDPERRPQVAVNPLLQDDEWSENGYYAYRTAARRLPRLWQVHGSLDFLKFEDCACVHPTPRQEQFVPYYRDAGGGQVRAKHFHRPASRGVSG